VPVDLLLFADTATGVVLLGCAFIMGLRQRRLGLIIAAAGLTWFLGAVVPALVLLHRGPLAQLHLSYPTGRVRRPLAVTSVVSAYGAALCGALIGGPFLWAALAVLITLAAVDVFRATSGPARKAAVPALVAAAVFSGVVALGAANVLLGLDADRVVLLVYDAAVCLMVCWLTLDLRYGRWSEATLADLVTQLGARREVSGLQGELRQRLGDPTLVLGLLEPDQQQYLDERGAPVEPSEADVVTPVLDGSEKVAVLVHDPVLLLDPPLLEGAARAVSLAVANGRGRREVAARGAEVAASSRRIVEAADAQRARLRDELQLGAEKHLHEVASILQRFDGCSTPVAREQLRVVRAEVDEGLTELGQLATGIRPAALSRGGLPAALPPLALSMPFACKVKVTVGRLPPAVESTLYFICSEALTNIAKHACATHATVTVEADRRLIVARVEDDGRGGADPKGSGLLGLADRVTALGGRLNLMSNRHAGTTVEARLPVNVEVHS
jgi:signal transduction histidine kinase